MVSFYFIKCILQCDAKLCSWLFGSMFYMISVSQECATSCIWVSFSQFYSQTFFSFYHLRFWLRKFEMKQQEIRGRNKRKNIFKLKAFCLRCKLYSNTPKCRLTCSIFLQKDDKMHIKFQFARLSKFII